MRFPCFLIAFLCTAVIPLHARVEWQTDYEKARSLSQQENKPVLLFFNGSDWSGSSMKMKHEILNAPRFQENIGDRFICMEIDFPKHSTLKQTLAAQNLELRNRFKVQDFPCLLLLDAQEKVIAQVSYLPENGEQLALDLLKFVEQDRELSLGLQQITTAFTSSDQLKKLYQIAQELGRELAIEQILGTGVKAQDPFFCLEKYRLLVEQGEMKNEEALSLRQKLLSFDPESELVNDQGIPFTLALIDFQELSQKNFEPAVAAQPLIEYLARFGQKDQKNVWRIEMMIAEVYLDADMWDEALKYAEQAYQAAPDTMHAELAHSLDYIRSAKR